MSTLRTLDNPEKVREVCEPKMRMGPTVTVSSRRPTGIVTDSMSLLKYDSPFLGDGSGSYGEGTYGGGTVNQGNDPDHPYSSS